MATIEYILVGGGEHARVVLDALLSSNIRVKALFDPKYSGKLFGVDQLGEYQPQTFKEALALVTIGNNKSRAHAAQSVSHAFGKLIHTSAIVSQFASIDEGAMVMQGAIIQANTKVGKHTIINTGARIDHDCVLDNFVHVAPGATLCGTVQVGEGTLIGAGSTIIPGIKIGKWVTIGAGAVVTRSIPDYSVATGVPARVNRQMPS